MSEKREFHIGDVLSAATGRLVSPRHIGGVYDILGFMSGQELMTHQLPRVSRECEPSLREQHPDLCAVDIPDDLNTEPKVLAWLATLYPQFGETVTVEALPPEDHTVTDPIAEFKMVNPTARIIEIGGV